MNKPIQAAAGDRAPAYERKRRFSRHHMDARIQVSVFREGETIVLWGRTSEIGEDGIGATLTGKLTPGEVVSIEFPVPVPGHFVRIRGIVRYTHGLHCGLEFLTVSEEQRNILKKVCEILERAL